LFVVEHFVSEYHICIEAVMIVNYLEIGWEVITQRAHGLLASQLALQWNVKERPSRWMETLLAIAEHDDAEVELSGENLLTPAGGPLNFSMKTFELQHCQQLSLLTQTKSRYIALLVSMHMVFLYQKEEASNKQVSVFLEEQRSLQAKWRKELDIKKEEAQRIYHLLEWCDAFSLLLCQRQIQPEKRSIEISTGPDKKAHHLQQAVDGLLTVTPWPFEADRFSVYFESREIHQLQFDSSTTFRKAFTEAQIKENVFQLARVVKK
jgi:hypothetical protein